MRNACVKIVRIFQLFIRNKLQNSDKYGRIRIGWRLCNCIVSIMTLSGVLHSKHLSHTVVCIVGSGCVWRVLHAMCMDRERRGLAL